MPPLSPSERPALPALRVIAAASLAACLWLTWKKWTGGIPPLAGCGGTSGGGCGAALTGRWSEWFSLPVTFLAAAVWGAVLVLTLPSVRSALGRAADQLLAGAATLLIVSAAWFSGLMLWEIRAFCPWCAALHAAGLIAGTLILLSTRNASKEGDPGLFAAAAQAGAASAALLILGQLFGTAPETHQLTGAAVSPEPPPGPRAPFAGLPERVYLDGALRFDPANVPLLGDPGAPQVLVEVFDYTCPACRTQHRDLKKLLRDSPGKFAVAAMPAPLDRACNPHAPVSPKGHEESCALTRLALAVWVENPVTFPAFHDFLMSSGRAPGLAGALAEARRLLPGRDLEKIASGPAVNQLLAENIRIHGILSRESSTMPKLILRGDRVLHGLPSGSRRFQEIIESEFTPPFSIPNPSIPVSAKAR